MLEEIAKGFLTANESGPSMQLYHFFSVEIRPDSFIPITNLL